MLASFRISVVARDDRKPATQPDFGEALVPGSGLA
jgi:hypothetical protein